MDPLEPGVMTPVVAGQLSLVLPDFATRLLRRLSALDFAAPAAAAAAAEPSIAASASFLAGISTNPNPLDSPLYLSLMSLTSAT